MKRYTILLVEDDIEQRQFYRLHLEEAGFCVIDVDGYAPAIEQLQQARVDLALLDLILDGKSGLDILKYIRKHYPLCPCIMISAYAGKKDVIEALREGAADYLEKPVDENELVHVMQHWASYSSLEQENIRLKDYETMSLLLAENQLKYKRLVDSCPSIIYSFSNRKGGLFYSQQAEKLLGYSIEHLYAHPFLWSESIHPEDRGRISQLIWDCKHSPNFSVEYRIRDANGNWHWFSDQSIDASEIDGEIIINGFAMDITERKQMEQALRDKEQLLSESQSLAHIGSWAIKDDCACWTTETYCIFGVSPDTFRPTAESFIERAHPDDQAVVREWVRACWAGEQPAELEYRVIRPDGSIKVIQGRGNLQHASDGTPLRIIGTVQDVTEAKKIEEDMRIAATVFEAQDCILITDANANVIRVNRAFTTVTGYSAEEVLGKNPRIMNSGRHDHSFYTEMWQQLLHNGLWAGEIWDKRKNGQVYPKWMTITAVKNERQETTQYVAIFSDITDRKRLEQEIYHLAFYDALTKLPNRRLFLDRFNAALSASVRHHDYGATLFIDLDHFKILNDTFGHEYGDLLLKEVSRRIKSCIREIDTVARFGGDEFVVLIENISKDRDDAISRVTLVAEKIREVLVQPYRLKRRKYHCTPSIGVSLFSGDEEPVDTVLKNADLAMYQAKNAGRNAVKFFDSGMPQIEKQSILEEDLPQAIVLHQLHLHYQIQVDKEGCPIGAEAFLRWIHPVHGMLEASQFIKIAEKSQLIIDIGNWVLEAACQQLVRWSKDDKTRNLVLTINVSGRQFDQPDFVDQVAGMLAKHQINPRCLAMDLAKRIEITDVGGVLDKIRALERLGIKLSIDNFGEACAMLPYLKQLSSGHIKLTHEFIRDIPRDDRDTPLIYSIISLAKLLDMSVYAEGVETEAQREFLRGHDCKTYQGYLFGKPVAIDKFEAMIGHA